MYDDPDYRLFTPSDEAAESLCGLFFDLIALAWNLLVVLPIALFRSLRGPRD